MAANEVAIVVGAGPGLGAALCRRFVKAGMLVAAATRDKERVSAVAKEAGARGYGCDAGDEKSVLELFAAVKRDFGEPSVVVYNAGAYLPKTVIDTSAEEFERCWRIGCFGGFLVGREAVRRMLPRGRGSVIFTGATASLRGKPGTTAFAAAKAGLRSLAQSMARAYGPQGIHVAHVVVDGGIAGDKIIQGIPQFAEAMGEDGLISLDGLADSYWFLYTQQRAAWTHELDLRTFKESF